MQVPSCDRTPQIGAPVALVTSPGRSAWMPSCSPRKPDALLTLQTVDAVCKAEHRSHTRREASMSQVLKALCKAHACSKRDETACKSVVGSTPAAASASAEAEGALTASECRRRAALSQTVMCLPAVESMGAAMPVPWKTYDPTMSDPNAQFPGACCTVRRFAAFPCKHLWTKSCKDMSPHCATLPAMQLVLLCFFRDFRPERRILIAG